MTKCTNPSASSPRCKGRQIIASFDGGDVTSEGGILLLRQLDREMGLTRAVEPSRRQEAWNGRHPDSYSRPGPASALGPQGLAGYRIRGRES